MIENWTDKRVTVMGLGRFGGGAGVTRWLSRQGARVLLTDKATPDDLRDALAGIADLDIETRLGGHNERDFRETDLLVVSPAVPDTNEFVRAARDAGVPVTTEINLFVERCPARTVGVTGSVGKSTTTAMIAHVLERTHAGGRTWVGGNLGRSLLDALGEITADDVVVLELSSFQLARTPLVGWSPHVAVVTNVAPNHLDWHGTYEAYVAAKLEIARFQDRSRDRLIIGETDELRRNVAGAVGSLADVWRYRLDETTPTATMSVTPGPLSTRAQRLRWDGVQLAIPGNHNRENAAAALTVAHCLGIDAEAAVAAIGSFEGLEHRLQRVAIRDGVTYYNDSKSTTPAAAITAMSAIEQPLLIILGGYDKGSDLTPAAECAARRAKFAACIGKTGPTLVEAVRNAGGAAELFDTLTAAVAACQSRAESGDAILLSPACASWGMFPDYRVRGEEFARLARG